MTTPAVERLWQEQSVWSQTANRMKTRIDTARWTALVLVVVVAVCGTAAATLGLDPEWIGRALAGIAAAGSAALPLLRPRWSGTRLKDWTRARSVSEALKTDVYLWLAQAGPFADDADASVLRRRTSALRVDAADLVRHQEGIHPATRRVPAVWDGRTYFDVRVAGQIDGYYARRAREISHALRRLRRVEVGLGGIGLVLGVIAAVTTVSLAAWVAVIATAGTALATHIAATRYEFQRIEFERTAERLRQIDEEARATGVTEARLRELAVQAEDVISVENQGWMAKLAEEPPDHAAPAGEESSATGPTDPADPR